jgi:hypothetical protein
MEASEKKKEEEKTFKIFEKGADYLFDGRYFHLCFNILQLNVSLKNIHIYRNILYIILKYGFGLAYQY